MKVNNKVIEELSELQVRELLNEIACIICSSCADEDKEAIIERKLENASIIE